MANIQINDLSENIAVSEEEMKHVKGGILIGLLLPAVQKVTETSTSTQLLGDGSVRFLGDGSV